MKDATHRVLVFLWTIGFLFTFGFEGAQKSLELLSSMSLFDQVFVLLIYYFIWPIYWGMKFGGHLQ